MAAFNDRWTLPDLESALRWCRWRNDQGIRCVLDVLGEGALGREEALRAAEAYESCTKAIAENHIDASLAVKPTALGAIND